MAYADLDSIHTPSAGTRPPASWGAQVNSNFDHIYDEVLVKLGAYTAYTPTLTNITLGSGGVRNGYYRLDGKTLFLRVRITLGTSGAFTGAGTISLPAGMTAFTETDQFQVIPAILRDTGTAVYKGHVQVTSGSSALTIYAEAAGGTYVSQAATSATVPHTWANTDVIAFHGSIEVN